MTVSTLAPAALRSRRYPRKIHLSDTAEACIADLAVDLVLDRLQLHQLPPSLAEFYEFAYEAGRRSRQAEIDYLNQTADRLYREVCRRVPPRQPNYVSRADLERIRGNNEHADQIDAANVRRFAEVL